MSTGMTEDCIVSSTFSKDDGRRASARCSAEWTRTRIYSRSHDRQPSISSKIAVCLAPEKSISTPSGPSYVYATPRSEPACTQPEVCIGRDLGTSGVALFKKYKEKPEDILGQTFIVATKQVSSAEMIQLISKAIGKPVEHKTIKTTTKVAIDEMYDYVNEFGMYRNAVILDPRLLALGVKFHPCGTVH